MIVNQRERKELQTLLVSKEVNLKFTFEKNGSICIKHPEFDFLNATVQRDNEKFILNYFQSTLNKTVLLNIKDFASLKYHLSKWFDLIGRDYPLVLNTNENIKNLSRRYYKVLEEAIAIRNLGFDVSSGMIFRKALEILIKDYFKYLLPSYEEVILNKTIGALIRYFYKINHGEFYVKQDAKFESIILQLQEIQPLCKKINNTFNIGNDFAHYERRLEKYTTEELHSNILKIEQFIDFHMQEDFLRDKKAFLSAEFDSEGPV